MSSPFSCPMTHHRFALEPAEAADDRLVLAVIAVARERRELGDEPVDVIGEARSALHAGDLGLLPGRQIGVEIRQRLVGPGLQPPISSAIAGNSSLSATARNSSSRASMSATGASKLR